MCQHAIGDKRASLSLAQRPRNGFCSTSGRRETPDCGPLCSAIGPELRKGSDFDADAVRFRIDVRLGRADAQRLHAAKGRETIEYRVRQRLLQVEPARRSDLLDFGAQEIVIPRLLGIVVRRAADDLRARSRLVTKSRCGAPTSNS